MSTRWARLGSLTGVPFVGAVVLSNVVSGGIPDTTATPAHVIAFYQAHRTGQQWSAILTTLAVVFGLFFFGSLSGYLRRTEATQQLASIGFAGAILFAAAGCVNAGLQWSLADHPTRLMPAAAQALNQFSKDTLATGFFGAGLAALMLAYGIAMLRSRLLPAWLGWATVVLGVVAAAGPLVFLVFVATAPWAITVSVFLYRRTGDTPLSV